jgi:hypothetical protein
VPSTSLPGGCSRPKKCAETLFILAKQIMSAQLAEAQKRARQWKEAFEREQP